MTLSPKESLARMALVDVQHLAAQIGQVAQTAIAAIDLTPPPPPVGPSAAFSVVALSSARQFQFTAAQPNLATYAWDWGGGATETHPFPQTKFTYKADGTYAVTLTVTDAAGRTAVSGQKVVVTSTPVPPPPPPPTGEVHAELPRVVIDTAFPRMTGKTILVSAGGDLQNALDAAQYGDVVALANGGTWTGNYLLRTKAGIGWICIAPSDWSVVPSGGTRIGPRPDLPKILSPNNQGAFSTENGAHHYRLVGLDISVPQPVANSGLVRFGSGYEQILAEMPHDLIVDRCYIHGAPTGNLRRAVVLNCANGAVIDSYISECHEHGSDSQAIAGWSGPGPFKIVNNYLEAASENINFGGADPLIQGLIPSDIDIRRNHLTKPLAWKGQNWNVKNLFELKNANRVLVEGNVFDSVWRDGQGGSAVNLKSVNQNQTAPWSCTRDVTIRLNLFRNMGSGFMLTGLDVGAAVPMERITITDNILTGIDVLPYDGDGRGFLVNSNPIDVVVAHNTILSPTNTLITFGGPATDPPRRFIFRDNLGHGGQYGVKGPGLNTRDTFTAFMKDGVFLGNVTITTDMTGYPPGNYFPASVKDVGFMSAADLHLSATSPYANKASDGRDPGADVPAVEEATAGVV